MSKFAQKMMAEIFAQASDEARRDETEVRLSKRRKAADEIHAACLAETGNERLADDVRRDFYNACNQGDSMRSFFGALFLGRE